MWRDPIVEEVRAAREKLAARWVKDQAGYRAHQKKVLEQWTGRVVSRAQLDKERLRTRGDSGRG